MIHQWWRNGVATLTINCVIIFDIKPYIHIWVCVYGYIYIYIYVYIYIYIYKTITKGQGILSHNGFVTHLTRVTDVYKFIATHCKASLNSSTRL